MTWRQARRDRSRNRRRPVLSDVRWEDQADTTGAVAGLRAGMCGGLVAGAHQNDRFGPTDGPDEVQEGLIRS
jgi:hypothetical protein